MKKYYWEINEPYYALIQSEDEEKAVQEYIDVVAGEQKDFENLIDELKEVPEYYAAAKYGRARSEDGELVELNEILGTLKSNETQVLLIDGSLL